MTDQEFQLKKFREIVNDVKFAMLVTMSQRKQTARPMTTLEIDEEDNLWFFTNEYNDITDEISLDSDVLLTYTDLSNQNYLCINGRAELSKDKEKIAALWKPAYKTWFKKGLDDPKLLLVKVVPDNIEYWDSGANKFFMAMNVLKAFITGKEERSGEHVEINLSNQIN